ncbi:hypothetical protein [Spirochaeta dissipatitropha]
MKLKIGSLTLLIMVCILVPNISTAELPEYAVSLVESFSSGERIAQTVQKHERYRQVWLQDRYATALSLNSLQDERKGAEFAAELAVPFQDKDESLVTELEALLMSEMPRPQTEAYHKRLAALRIYQIQSGVSAELIDLFIDTAFAFTQGDYSSEQIQNYFANAGRLTIDAPRGDDIRTWRFLLTQDLSQQLLVTLSRSGDNLVSGIYAFAEDVSSLDAEASAQLTSIATHIMRLNVRHSSLLSWLAALLDNESSEDREKQIGFLPGDIPVFPVEIAESIRKDPLVAASFDYLRNLLPQGSKESDFIKSVIRLAVTSRRPSSVAWSDFFTTMDLIDDDPVYFSYITGDESKSDTEAESDSGTILRPVIMSAARNIQPLLIDDSWITEYLHKARASRNSLQTFERQQGRAWSSDLYQKTEVFGSRIMQESLAGIEDQRLYEIMRDAQREWLDGLRIAGSRRIEYYNAGFPETILVIEKGTDESRIQRALDIWLRDTANGSEAHSFSLNPREWFAAHGLIILPVDRDHIIWHGDIGDAAAEASRYLSEMLDSLHNSPRYPKAFLEILTTDVAIRIAGLQHIWISRSLEERVRKDLVRHPVDYLHYEKLSDYLYSLEIFLDDLSREVSTLPSLLQVPFGYISRSAESNEKAVAMPWLLSYLSLKTMLELTDVLEN